MLLNIPNSNKIRTCYFSGNTSEYVADVLDSFHIPDCSSIYGVYKHILFKYIDSFE